jgi:hypothetical protein
MEYLLLSTGADFVLTWIVILRPALPNTGYWTRFLVCGTGPKLLYLILLMLITKGQACEFPHES